MDFTRFDLKNICDFENKLKDDLKNIKKDIPIINQRYEVIDSFLNKLQAFSLLILGLNFIIPGNKTAGNVLGISIYLIVTFNKWLEEKKNYLDNIYLSEYKNNIDETIDALELLKDFLRNKKIDINDKIFIVERLYLIYKDNLEDILLDIEEEQGTKIQLVINQK